MVITHRFTKVVLDAPVVETREITENLYIDLDGKGNMVSMTIEHAKEKANIAEVSFLQMLKSGA